MDDFLEKEYSWLVRLVQNTAEITRYAIAWPIRGNPAVPHLRRSRIEARLTLYVHAHQHSSSLSTTPRPIYGTLFVKKDMIRTSNWG